MVSQSRSSGLRYALAGLLAFGALNAFAGGYYGLSGAPGVPVEWLEGSPFSDYTVPSLIPRLRRRHEDGGYVGGKHFNGVRIDDLTIRLDVDHSYNSAGRHHGHDGFRANLREAALV